MSTPSLTPETGPPGPHHLDRATRPDPGTPKAARLAWILLAISFLAVAGIQALSAMAGPSSQPVAPELPSETVTDPAAEQPTPSKPAPAEPPPAEPMFEMVSRITLATSTHLQPVQDQDELEQAIGMLASMARSEGDRLRVAILAGELGRTHDPERSLALRRLELVQTEGDQELAADVFDLSTLYSRGVLGDDRRQRLLGRYPFYAELALEHDRPDGQTPGVLDALMGLLVAVVSLTVIGAIALGVGAILLLVGVVGVLTGRLRSRFVPPVRGGSVYLEAVVVFTGGFLLLKIILALLSALPLSDTALMIIGLGLQWVLLLAAFWPLVRGEKFDDWCLASGWHRGAGVLKEMAWGIAGWIAAVPLFVGAGVLSSVLVVLWKLIAGGDDEARPLPDAAVFDTIASGNVILTVAIFALATIWAPLAEESIFRGCFYRHLRGLMRAMPAAIISACIFGFMHGYGVLFLPPVIALGFAFAMMREWRGSIIAAVTAHMLHNATLVIFMITITRLMG